MRKALPYFVFLVLAYFPHKAFSHPSKFSRLEKCASLVEASLSTQGKNGAGIADHALRCRRLANGLSAASEAKDSFSELKVLAKVVAGVAKVSGAITRGLIYLPVAVFRGTSKAVSTLVDAVRNSNDKKEELGEDIRDGGNQQQLLRRIDNLTTRFNSIQNELNQLSGELLTLQSYNLLLKNIQGEWLVTSPCGALRFKFVNGNNGVTSKTTFLPAGYAEAGYRQGGVFIKELSPTSFNTFNAKLFSVNGGVVSFLSVRLTLSGDGSFLSGFFVFPGGNTPLCGFSRVS